jgi:hypothetical protein
MRRPLYLSNPFKKGTLSLILDAKNLLAHADQKEAE